MKETRDFDQPQCEAILPRGGEHYNDGWLNCALNHGHTGPHRTCYVGIAAAIGDPNWTFDRAAREALPSPYLNPRTGLPAGQRRAQVARRKSATRRR